jgi:cell wall-associated NlpC family hydrolase
MVKATTSFSSLISCALLLGLTGCAHQPDRADSARASRNDARASIPNDRAETLPREISPGQSIAALAQSLVGTPYEYGGADPSGFDCSGLVFYTHTLNGISVPRTSQEQFRSARKIRLTEAAAGDLVFFQDSTKLSHVGIYIGDDMFIHAPETGRHVSVARLSAPYYQEHLVAVGRLAER